MPTQPLVGGLKRCNHTEVLTPGDAYVVRFKNPLREYRTDLWLGIIVSYSQQAGSRLHRRPQAVKPVEGPWTTPLNERVYPIYMPGRNCYRFAAVHDLFLLSKEVPRIFAPGSDREGAELFRTLHKIARKSPELAFWEQMAEKEIQAKGKRSRQLSLILPEGFGHLLSDITADELGILAPNSPASSAIVKTNTEDPPATRPPAVNTAVPTTYSFGSTEIGNGPSSVLPVPLSFPGESTLFLSHVRGQPRKRRLSATDVSHEATPNRSHSHETWQEMETSMIPLRLRSVHALGDPSEIKIKTEESNSQIPAEEKTKIFEMSLRQVLDSIILQKPESVELLAIFTDTVNIQGREELEQMKSFLITNEFVPRLVQVNNPAHIIGAVEGSQTIGQNDEIQIGDCQGIGRKYQLQGVSNSDDLCRHILAFGRLSQQARRLGLASLTSLITWKLQVAWNSYPGLCQLEPLLGVLDMAFHDCPDTQDELQVWLINFIADTIDLIYYSCSGRFWQVMEGKSSLQRMIFDTRAKLVRENPAKYPDPLVLLRSRGIDEV